MPIQHPHYVCKAGCALNQGSPTPGPRTSTMVRNQPHSRMQVVGTQAKLLRLCLQSFPIARITARARPAIRSAAALGSNRSVNPIVLLILKPSPQPSQSMEKSSCMKITGLWCQKRLGSAALNTQAMETAESDLAPRKLTILKTQQ